MNEFTPEWIEEIRNTINVLHPPMEGIIKLALDEIARLKARVQELEHYERLQHEWVKEKIEGLNTFEEIEKMFELADKVSKQLAIPIIHCGWCIAEFETQDEVREHLLTCKDNPLAQRIAELECQLKSKQIVIESKEQTIREFAEKMLDLRKR